jgi:hypothetical protein
MNDTSNKPVITSVEAPASWNTRYQTPEGFVCQITLRADSGTELLEKSNVAINHLLAVGCTPYETTSFRPKGNNNNHKSQNNAAQVTENSSNESSETHLCPIHNVAMKRWEKDGRVWYSHKNGDNWCTGK